MNRRPVLTDEDKQYFMDLLNKQRRFDPEKWRTAVRGRTRDCFSHDALDALCDIVVESEELEASIAKKITFDTDTMDYGLETGVCVSAQMTPLKKITLDVLLKLLAAVLREKQCQVEVWENRANHYKGIIERSWIQKLGDLVERILGRSV